MNFDSTDLLYSSLMDKFIGGTLTTQRKRVPYYSLPAPIFGVQEPKIDKIENQLTNPFMSLKAEKEFHSELVRVE